MKLIGSRWRERVGKPGLIENEQRVVRTLFGLWIVSGEGADAGILSEMPGSVGHQRVGRQLSDSALLCRSWSINSSSASLAITAVWSLPITPLSVLRIIYPCEIHGYYTV